MELELKHLCGYLPYKLKCKYLHKTMDGKAIENRVFILDSFVSHGNWRYWTHDQSFLNNRLVGKGLRPCDFKPLLLPLSALTEPLDDGSIPIVELARIAFTKSETIKLDGKTGMALIDTAENYSFQYKNGSFECVYLRYSPRVQMCYVPNQLQLFEYLYSKHFWLGDQSFFEQGIIIDKRTIK